MTTVDTNKLTEAATRASELMRHTIFLLVRDVRANTWAFNKPLMERSIPIFEALIAVDPHKHDYFGELGFTYKDRIKPDLPCG